MKRDSLTFQNQVIPTERSKTGLILERARRISVVMCKGGVGKTTTTLFLARRLSDLGYRVLIIDADPQSNLTAALRLTQPVTERTPVLLDVLMGRIFVQDAIVPVTPSLHVLPSTAMNSLLERHLIQNTEAPVGKLNQVLTRIETLYDFIFIDSAPTLNVINAAIIYASDAVLLPIQLDEFSRLGLRQTVTEIQDLEREFAFKTHKRILVNKFNAREKLTLGYLGFLAAEYKPLLLQTVIRQCSDIKIAQALNKSFFTKTASRAREDFNSLAEELLCSRELMGVTHAEY